MRMSDGNGSVRNVAPVVPGPRRCAWGPQFTRELALPVADDECRDFEVSCLSRRPVGEVPQERHEDGIMGSVAHIERLTAEIFAHDHEQNEKRRREFAHALNVRSPVRAVFPPFSRTSLFRYRTVSVERA